MNNLAKKIKKNDLKVSAKELDTYFDTIVQPVVELMQECNNSVIEVICARLKTLGADGLTASEINKLANLSRVADISKIESIVSKTETKATAMVKDILNEVANQNNLSAKDLYTYRGVEQLIENNADLSAIIGRAIKTQTDGLLNLSETTAFNLGGRTIPLRQAYTNAVNTGIYQASQGLLDYSSAIRQTVRQLSASGMQKVDYASGYSRRLDSSVRMNIMDGIHGMNQEYRYQQSKEYGGDMVFVSLHHSCAKDHQQINGMSYTAEQFEEINNNLARKVGELNCHHNIRYGIQGISKNPYNDDERKAAIKDSNEVVEFKTISGNTKKVTKYEFTQEQRKVETNIRKLKDQKFALSTAGDSVGAKNIQKKITEKTKYYKSMSNNVDIVPRLERTRIVTP